MINNDERASSRTCGYELLTGGRARLPLHPRRHECRARPDLRRVCLGNGQVYRQGERRRSAGVRAAHRKPGIQFPLRRRTRGSKRPTSQRFRAPALESGDCVGPSANMALLLTAEAAWGGGRQRRDADLRRLRLRRRAMTSSYSARQALPGSPDLDEPHPPYVAVSVLGPFRGPSGGR